MIGRVIAILCAAVLAGGAGWGVGFGWFSHVARQKIGAPASADGIVALTGGAERIGTALRLLADGVAPVLLVSGVARGADLAELARRVPLDAGPLAGRVTLGRTATSTVGNAAEIAPWARSFGMRRIAVVTAGYHMPRALLEIHWAAPELILVPVPVQPPSMRGRLDYAALRVLTNEYDKLIAARLGLARLLRHEGDES